MVRHLCDRVAALHLGTLLELGSVAQVYGSPRHAYTAGRLAAQPRLAADKA
ncbi:hypothetical protein [Azorhizobium oxalatiphilum]|uniref:hypothetical protein n=1 Tax=Azorhizobium oxalatiphilum TaxID=980631 RepID=UPI00166D7024|nr:hypothetical protein [Azorhizobium oxalatiphilum]